MTHARIRPGTLRRVVDIVAAFVLLLVSLPLLAAAALAVYIDTGRPIFFGHTRVGLGGRPFRCWKLRTMTLDAEARLAGESELKRRYVENGFKLPEDEDPRVTPVGRWLRRRYLDELPQLVNVLGGSMSLVGPRPVVADELACFGKDAQVLLATKPGLFGEWNSRGRARPPYPERARLEIEYVRGQSFARDLTILARSIGAVLSGQAPQDRSLSRGQPATAASPDGGSAGRLEVPPVAPRPTAQPDAASAVPPQPGPMSRHSSAAQRRRKAR